MRFCLSNSRSFFIFTSTIYLEDGSDVVGSHRKTAEAGEDLLLGRVVREGKDARPAALLARPCDFR
jgi:hypothetical protein